MSAHPLHVSWPHRELHRRLLRQGSHASPSQFRHTPHSCRCPIGSSAESSCSRVHMRPTANVRHTPRTFRGRFVAPEEAPPKALVAGCACAPQLTSPRPSQASWPHIELQRRFQRSGSHASPGQFRHSPQTLRGPVGNSTEGSCGRVSHASPSKSGAPLARFAAPQRAPPKAPVAGFACAPQANFIAPIARFVAPLGASPKAPAAGFARIPQPIVRHAPRAFRTPHPRAPCSILPAARYLRGGDRTLRGSQLHMVGSFARRTFSPPWPSWGVPAL